MATLIIQVTQTAHRKVVTPSCGGREPGKTPFWQTLVWAVLLWLALKFFNFL